MTNRGGSAMTVRRTLIVRFAAALLVGVAVVAVTAVASASHSSGHHWAGQGERTIIATDCVESADYDVAIRDSAAAWSKSPYIDILVVPCDDPDENLELETVDRPTAGYDAYTANRYLASDPEHFDPHGGMYTYYNVPKLTPARLRGQVCHQMGRTLGLVRRTATASCMDTRFPVALPDAHDYEQLEAIYNHRDPNQCPG